MISAGNARRYQVALHLFEVSQNISENFFDLYGWISLMSQLIIINRALYVNKQQEGKICAIT